MKDIDVLLDEIDHLDKIETALWYRKNKLRLVELVIETPNHSVTIGTIAQRIGNGLITQVKQELTSLCKLEEKRRYEQHTKDSFNIDISKCHVDKNGKLISDYHNLKLIGQTELWDKVKFDDFSGEVKMVKRPPWENHLEVPFKERFYQDTDTTEAVAWFNQFGIQPRRTDVGHVLFALAMQNRFDAYQEWMNAKPKWDGKRRLNTYLFRYCGSWPRNRREWRIISAYGRKLFISMVARCFNPGCMARLVFLFEGSQNIMKSLFVEAIGVPFFAEMHGRNLDLNKSDSHTVLNGKALIDIPENILGKKNDADNLKAYFSQRVARVRLPYGHHPIELVRRNVFTITLNPGADRKYFNDPTGGTRYCVIEVGVDKLPNWKIDLEGFLLVRDQLFAEAIVAFNNGEKWWLDEEQEQLQKEHVDTRQVDNPAEYFVHKYLDGNPGYLVGGIHIDDLISCMKSIEGCPNFSRQLIAEALKSLGFEQDRFTLTKAEKLSVDTTTRQIVLWFPLGTKVAVMNHRNDPTVSVFRKF